MLATVCRMLEREVAGGTESTDGDAVGVGGRVVTAQVGSPVPPPGVIGWAVPGRYVSIRPAIASSAAADASRTKPRITIPPPPRDGAPRGGGNAGVGVVLPASAAVERFSPDSTHTGRRRGGQSVVISDDRPEWRAESLRSARPTLALRGDENGWAARRHLG